MTDVELIVYDNYVDINLNNQPIVIEMPLGLPGANGDAKRMGSMMLTGAGVPIVAANSVGYIRILPELNGMSLIHAGASVATSATSGTMQFQYRRVRAGQPTVNMFSTPISIDSGEIDSSTAATQAVINPSNRQVQTGDQVHFDITTVGTGALGAEVSFVFDTI